MLCRDPAGIYPRMDFRTRDRYRHVVEDLAKKNPKAQGADPKSFIEPRFLKELEDSGFISRLYGK